MANDFLQLAVLCSLKNLSPEYVGCNVIVSHSYTNLYVHTLLRCLLSLNNLSLSTRVESSRAVLGRHESGSKTKDNLL